MKPSSGLFSTGFFVGVLFLISLSLALSPFRTAKSGIRCFLDRKETQFAVIQSVQPVGLLRHCTQSVQLVRLCFSFVCFFFLC